MRPRVSALATPSAGTARHALVIDLAAIDATMLPVAGGKAANLGELIAAGLPVPPGFCVTTEAYAQVAASVAIPFDALGSAPPGELERLAGQARDAVAASPIPGPIAAAVVEAYNRLGRETPVAVRSSATAEDLPYASFAGQQDTYLHIIGAEAVLDAVRRCWASLWTGRAVVYRNTNGIDHRAVRLAVVVQRMVAAEVAGVLFTANPVTGRRRQAVIDASPGLGEAVVSGTVNPDHFVVDSASGEIVERRLGDKRLEVRSVPGGGTRHVERAAAADRACIADDQLRSLAALGEKVEAHFGSPQDTEWAIDGGGALWLTQARPITTLFPLPAPPKDNPAELQVYFCFSVAQGLYRPITPMGLAAFRVLGSAAARILGGRVDDPVAGPPEFAAAGQRVFIDITAALRSRLGRAVLPRVFDVMEARSAAILRHLFDNPRLAVKGTSWVALAATLLRNLVRFRIPQRVLQALVRPDAARERVARIVAGIDSRFTPPASADSLQRLDFVEHALATEVLPMGPSIMPAAAVGLAMNGLAAKVLANEARPDELQTVLRGLPHNVTTTMDLALWELANSIRQDPPSAQMLLDESPAELARRFHSGSLPRAAQRGLTEFLSRFGHRAVAEIDIGMPRWSGDPTHILGVLANYLRLDNPDLAPDTLFARGAAEAEAMIETLASRARLRGRLRAWLARFALTRARQLSGLRETPKYCFILAFAALRRELARIGTDLAQRGSIADADDVFFLALTEVRAGLHGRDLHEVVEQRRHAYQAELRRRRIPRVLLSDGTEPEALFAAPPQAGGIAGTPASAGTVTGIARVILDPVGARLEPGEILVAPSTDPGWTPLFLTAGGLVMEMGGPNSHGAVVAREYGIPAVVGVPDATVRIATGQRISVDGSTGTIGLL